MTFLFVVLLGVKTVANCNVSLTSNEVLLAVSVNEVANTTSVTSNVKVALTPFSPTAVIVVVPALIAVTSPLLLTVATLTSLDE